MIWILLALFLVCSGLISSSETALFALDRQKMGEFARSTRASHRRVATMMEHPRSVLMTVLIANTAVNVAIFALSSAGLQGLQPSNSTIVAVESAGVLLAVIIFGEMMPKAVAVAHARRLAPAAGTIIATLRIGLGPIGAVLRFILVDPIIRLVAPASKLFPLSTDDLRQLVEHSANEGVFDHLESEMLQAAVALDDIQIHEVMTPRVDIRFVMSEWGRDDVAAAFKKSRWRKLPVCTGDLDDINGILRARDFHLNPDRPFSQVQEPVQFVPEQASLVQLLRWFRSAGAQLAIVVDEYGGTAGLVTMNDVLKRIVRDLPDTDMPKTSPSVERIDENTYRVSGNLSVRLWAERFAVGEIDEHVDTLGGFVASQLRRLPCASDAVRIRNLTITVESMQDRRISTLLVQRDRVATSMDGARA